MLTPAEAAALEQAVALAETVGVPPGPNPRVGCVILDPGGVEVGRGFHRGAGTAHAEVDALAVAGERARGATAIVTLEPCNHHGRTGPCTQALIDAGIARVVYAQPDPTSLASGGAQRLAAAGVDVELAEGASAERARVLLEPWVFAERHGRPFVTVKMASSLDGRIAAADGTSRWITGPVARQEVHLLRRQVDAVLVGRGTVIADDPTLTIRDVDSGGYQPVRVVMGKGELPEECHLLTDGGPPTLHLRTHDPHEALRLLAAEGVHHLLCEGGPTLVAAWIEAGVVDRLVWFTAPVILGAGPSAVGDIGVHTIADASRWTVVSVDACGQDARIIAVPGTDTRPVVLTEGADS